MDIADSGPGEADPRPSGKNISGPREKSLWPSMPPLRKKVIAKPAGWLRRATAFSIDLLIIAGLYLVLVFIGIMGIREIVDAGGPFSFKGAFAPFVSGGFFLFIGYFTFFHAYDGQTPAKMILRIRVTTMGGNQLTPFHAALRAAGYFLSGPLSFGIGFLLSIVEKRKRALHDLLTDSQVVLSP